MHQASVGFVQLFIAGVNSFGEPKHIRAIGLALDLCDNSNDPQLQAELQLFDRDCYLPALAKLESASRQTVVNRRERPRSTGMAGGRFLVRYSRIL